MKTLQTVTGLAVWSTAAAWAAAHPGHGSSQNADGARHYLLEAAHALPIAAVVAGLLLAAGAWWLLRKAKARGTADNL